MLTSQCSPKSGDEDSSKYEEYITARPSNTTASRSATTDIPPSTDGNVQLVSDVPYLEESLPPNQATDNVSIKHDSEPDSDSEPSDSEHDNKSPTPPTPRRRARSTKGAPPMHYGMAYIHNTVI